MTRLLLLVLALASAGVAVALYPVKTVTQATEPETNIQPASSITTTLAAPGHPVLAQQPVAPTEVKPVIIPASFSVSSAPEVSKVLPPPSAPPKNPDSAAALNATVTISGPRGEGSGFFCTVRGQCYVVTNQHVLAVGSPLSIRAHTGVPLTPRSILAATDADLALLDCGPLPPGVTCLECATLPDPRFKKSDPTLVFGNSRGDGVTTQTPGTLLAIGPSRVEVDNPVYHGNSGGPIVHQETGCVLGVLTEAKLMKFDAIDKASFNSKTSAITSEIRYFGYRLDSVQQWEPLQWTNFQVNQQLIDNSLAETGAIVGCLTGSSAEYRNFSEFHLSRNTAAKVCFDRNSSRVDKSAAYLSFLRDMDRFASRAKSRLNQRNYYFCQRNDVLDVTKSADLISRATEMLKMDHELVVALLNHGN